MDARAKAKFKGNTNNVKNGKTKIMEIEKKDRPEDLTWGFTTPWGKLQRNFRRKL